MSVDNIVYWRSFEIAKACLDPCTGFVINRNAQSWRVSVINQKFPWNDQISFLKENALPQLSLCQRAVFVWYSGCGQRIGRMMSGVAKERNLFFFLNSETIFAEKFCRELPTRHQPPTLSFYIVLWSLCHWFIFSNWILEWSNKLIVFISTFLRDNRTHTS